MKMKKMLLGTLLGMFTLAGVAVLPNYASAQGSEGGGADTDAEFFDLFNDNSGKLNTTNQLNGEGSAGATGIRAVRRTINLMLTILSTIAVVICMYGGFLMMTAGGDEKKYQKGLGVLKYAAIGLAIIALSWIIVSVIFWFVNAAAGGSGDVTDGGANSGLPKSS